MQGRRSREAETPARAAILHAATHRFEAVGYNATSLREIAAGAGITPAAIYHHFPSKHSILLEVMVRALTDSLAQTRGALLAAGGNPEDQLRAIVHSWIAFHTERRSEAIVGSSEIRSLEPSGYKIVAMLRDEQEATFRDTVLRGTELQHFATPQPLLAARAVLEMGRAVASWYRPDGPQTVDELAEIYAELALAAVQVRR